MDGASLGSITSAIKTHHDLNLTIPEVKECDTSLNINLCPLTCSILEHLENRNPESGTICIPCEDGDLIFKEENGGITLSKGEKSNFKPDCALKLLHTLLLENVIEYGNFYPDNAYIKAVQQIVSRIDEFSAAAAKLAIEDTLNRLQCHERITIKGVLLYLINNEPYFVNEEIYNRAANEIIKSDHEFAQEIVTKAEDHMINNPRQFPNADILSVAYRLIRNSRPCRSMDIPHTVVHIRNHPGPFSAAVIKSCFIYIINSYDDFTKNGHSFPRKMIDQALQDVADHPTDYHLDTIADAASIVVNDNLSFFKTPYTDQKTFQGCFNTKEKLAAITAYSHGLTNLLNTDTRQFTYRTHKATLLDLWEIGRFGVVLKNSEKISSFIVKHWNHRALIEWDAKAETPWKL